MKIIGFKFTKISGEKFKEPEKNINLNSNFNLGEIKKEKVLTNKKETPFSLDFTNTLNYEDVATIEFKGVIFISIDNKSLKEFEKNKTIKNPEDRKIILDFILRRIHVEALHLEERLSLPFHIQSPTVNIEKN